MYFMVRPVISGENPVYIMVLSAPRRKIFVYFNPRVRASGFNQYFYSWIFFFEACQFRRELCVFFIVRELFF